MRPVRLSTLLTCIAATLLAASLLPAAQLELGVAAIDITPDDGEAFEPLMSKAMVLKQGNETAVIVVCDLLIITRDVSLDSRKLASERTGIPAEMMTIIATHTHTGGIRDDLVELIAQSIVEAKSKLQPVVMRAGTMEQFGISFNRRFLMKDGTVIFNPGIDDQGRAYNGGSPFLNPEIVRPVGPIDPEVNFALFETPSGNPVGALTAFTMHVCTAGQKYSSDYPHFLEQTLRRKFGDDFISVFGPGPSGDVNHFDVSKPGPQSDRLTVSKPLGEKLGHTILAKVDQLDPEPEPKLKMLQKTLQIPLQTYSRMDLDWAREATENNFADFDPNRAFLARVRARTILQLADARLKYGESMPVEIHAMRLSEDTAVAFMPSEPFVELGLDLKAASPFPNTFVVELADEEAMSYIPTRKAFSEGGYEVVYSWLVPAGGEMIVDGLVDLLNDLKATIWWRSRERDR